ncbi:hypothetical protein EX30DRAFT_365924 [Ascodesmis nigricans]|uniref:Uncharacterized protein n=1 Tax=Ascodesmis nigricans TaxID=341454 RepID=A0A4S2MNC3_9PEZI|nr:hypothetical protein EX30DRAFT_365924 [Ascodesmis nigricans]
MFLPPISSPSPTLSTPHHHHILRSSPPGLGKVVGLIIGCVIAIVITIVAAHYYVCYRRYITFSLLEILQSSGGGGGSGGDDGPGGRERQRGGETGDVVVYIRGPGGVVSVKPGNVDVARWDSRGGGEERLYVGGSGGRVADKRSSRNRRKRRERRERREKSRRREHRPRRHRECRRRNGDRERKTPRGLPPAYGPVPVVPPPPAYCLPGVSVNHHDEERALLLRPSLHIQRIHHPLASFPPGPSASSRAARASRSSVVNVQQEYMSPAETSNHTPLIPQNLANCILAATIANNRAPPAPAHTRPTAVRIRPWLKSSSVHARKTKTARAASIDEVEQRGYSEVLAIPCGVIQERERWLTDANRGEGKKAVEERVAGDRTLRRHRLKDGIVCAQSSMSMRMMGGPKMEI